MRKPARHAPPATRRAITLRAQLFKRQQHGAEGDRRVGDVEGRPVETGGVPLDEVDDGTEADAVDNIAERAGEDQRQ